MMKIDLNIPLGKMLIMAVVASLLAGCSGVAATLVATQPPAVTVVLTLPASPTSQPTLPATSTPAPAPTSTLFPTATETLAPTPTQTASVARPHPTAIKPPLSANVLKVWSYSNTTVYIANVGFTLAIYMQNTGTNPWEPGYQLRFTGLTNGGDVTVQPEQDLTLEVKPGGKVEFDLWAFGSETLGDHTWYFQLFTNEGKEVPGSECSFTFTMIHN